MNSYEIVVVLCFGAIFAHGQSTDDGQTGQIIVQVGKRCLDVPSGKSNNTTPQVQVWDCHGGQNQIWTRMTDGTIRNNGQCLNVRGNSLKRGTAVNVRSCNKTKAQQFRFSSTGAIVFDPKENNKNIRCLVANQPANRNGAVLVIGGCAKRAPNQKWTFKQ